MYVFDQILVTYKYVIRVIWVNFYLFFTDILLIAFRACLF